MLTVCLSPAEVVSQVTVARIQDNASVEPGRIEEGLLRKILLPVEHVGGGELGGDVRHQFTVEKETKRQLTFYFPSNICSLNLDGASSLLKHIFCSLSSYMYCTVRRVGESTVSGARTLIRA